MKFGTATKLLALACVADAFAPSRFATRPLTSRSLVVEPSSLTDVFSSFSLADAVDVATDAMQQAAPAVDAAAKGTDNGWFGILTGPTEAILELLHSALVTVGLKDNSWGVAIIAMTIVIKLLTFPLTKTQLESTNKMQALQPTIKDIQAKYQSNPEVMNQKIAEVYQTNQVNPLAGCLPSLVQIPIFIGLYRAVLDLAKENKLNEGFLFLPSLQGPVYGADPTQGSAWLFSGWTDGTPSLGWDDTLAFLILPVFLVISQFVSMELMSPKDQPQQSNAVLKVLPLMIGWFSLNVPSALCIYWVTNNIVTTATSLVIRNSMKMEPATVSGTTTAPPSPSESSVFAPPPLREKPAGFGSNDGVNPITNAIDAEVVDNDEAGDSSGEGMAVEVPENKKRGKKKKKRRKN
eukprot:scaffold1561_cov129-Cylindrotheca_fusiformis.AAC.21